MPHRLVTVAGILVRGHGVASGIAAAGPYPAGTIALQVPHFQRLGLDLSLLFPATVNVSIRPLQFALTTPRYTFRDVAWTDTHPPEHFSFSPCCLRFAGEAYDGFVYYPHPETKRDHHQDPSTLEIITSYVAGLGYGDAVELSLDPTEITVTGSE